MTERQDDVPAVAATLDMQAARRSRWQRFSPSMGWKAFWSEILIVVLGVAIALAASEAVEDWNWRTKVKDGEVRLREDTADVFAWSAERYATAPCIDAQLAAMVERIMNSGERLDPVPIHTLVNQRLVLIAPQRPFRYPIWNALVADGTASRMSQPRQVAYGRLGDSMARTRLRMEEFMRLRGRLLVLGHPITLDAVTRNQLLTDLEELRAMNAADARSLGQDMAFITETELAPAAEQVEEFLAASVTVHFCNGQGLPTNDWRDVSGTLVGIGNSVDAPSKAAVPK